MNKKNTHTRIVIVLISLCLLSSTAWAGAKEIKARMAERLPVIMDLKAKGVVGENSQGLLEFRGAQKERADVVDAENKDRMTVYKAIAKKTGSTVDLVGNRRAKQIAERAGSGEWVQTEDGDWLQK